MLRDRVARAHRYGYDLNAADEMLDIIVGHEVAALGFAAWALAWEALPEDERDTIKQAHRQEHKSAWMAENPPSERQLGYLRSLGYAGMPPATMAEASEAIDRLVSAQKKAARR